VGIDPALLGKTYMDNVWQTGRSVITHTHTKYYNVKTGEKNHFSFGREVEDSRGKGEKAFVEVRVH
jgi:hypothetical protein